MTSNQSSPRTVVDARSTAVVMASSDMPEIVGLSHRAFVMRAGGLVGTLVGGAHR